MKGWILNVVRFIVRCGSHNHSYLYLNLWRHQLSRKVPRKVHVFIPRSKAPTSLLGAIKVVHQTPFFLSKHSPLQVFIWPSCLIQQPHLFESGGTPNVVIRSKDISITIIVSQHFSKTNHIEMCKVHPKSWHVTKPSFMIFQHDQPLIMPTLFLMWWLCATRKKIKLKGGVCIITSISTIYNVLLDSNVPPLMLGKVVMTVLD